jgi:hypothetical protein
MKVTIFLALFNCLFMHFLALSIVSFNPIGQSNNPLQNIHKIGKNRGRLQSVKMD